MFMSVLYSASEIVNSVLLIRMKILFKVQNIRYRTIPSYPNPNPFSVVLFCLFSLECTCTPTPYLCYHFLSRENYVTRLSSSFPYLESSQRLLTPCCANSHIFYLHLLILSHQEALTRKWRRQSWLNGKR
jgi:hypothetical protein